MNITDPYDRYHRQIILKEFGEQAQQKLMQSKVVVIGAGGLGCPALQYLVAAGVGTIGIVDDDVVALHNLQRQVLYTVNDIGASKAERAAARLQQLNPDIIIIPYHERLTTQNAFTVINAFDIVIDGTDNFSTRYMINDACVLLNKPLVYGAISQYEGQLAVFNYRKHENDEAVNYRDLFPEPPANDEVLNCAESGVLGVLPGIIGTMMANETIKLITGIGESLINQLMTYNGLNNQIYQLTLFARQEEASLIPKDEKAFLQTDYERLCASSSKQTAGAVFEIDNHQFNKLLASVDVALIDVRELDETPLVNEFVTRRIPLTELKENVPIIKENTVLFFCQTGKRSLQAAQWLFDIFGETKKIHSLQGGIVQWKQQYTKQTV
jgi:molybdopterin/thiamine biosynthesis adenylyltransferase/rhodanese-related sulfurtransferase